MKAVVSRMLYSEVRNYKMAASGRGKRIRASDNGQHHPAIIRRSQDPEGGLSETRNRKQEAWLKNGVKRYRDYEVL